MLWSRQSLALRPITESEGAGTTECVRLPLEGGFGCGGEIRGSGVRFGKVEKGCPDSCMRQAWVVGLPPGRSVMHLDVCSLKMEKTLLSFLFGLYPACGRYLPTLRAIMKSILWASAWSMYVVSYRGTIPPGIDSGTRHNAGQF